MKFTDGNWMMNPGVTAAYPNAAHYVEATAKTLTIHAPTKRIIDRGSMLDGPMLTVEFSSPLPDVVCVRLTHFAGAQPKLPNFQLFSDDSSAVEIASDDQAATFSSGRLAARVVRGPWLVQFVADGRVITESGRKAMGSVDVAGDGHYMHEQLALGVGEQVYGLGERFTAFAKNGQVVETWNKDGGTGSEQAYKNVPFYLTNRGYGVFVNHPENVSFEVGSEKVSRVQFSVAGETLEYFVIYGPTPKEVLEKYTALTGRPALPPAWSFGLWLSTSFTTPYDEETVTHFIGGMAERDIPLSVFHFDCFWMREFRWTDFEWDTRAFPDPAAMLGRLKERGLRICVWINPYIAQLSPLFAEGKREGFLLKKPNGDVWQWDLWQPGMAIVDFTNPAACQWYGDHLRRLLDMGVDAFKTDFGERIPTDVIYHDGSDPQRMHNFYSYLYNKTVFDVLKERRGEGEAVLFARSATAGGQQFPVHWGGDNDSTFESMAETLRGGLSLGLSGFGFWSHDIGGFEGDPPADLYKRWVVFGLLSSHSRLHGSRSYRVPWLIDEEAVAVARQFTRLKCSLMPYLFAAATVAHKTGVPVMRAMLLEFPDDPTTENLDRQYMLGDSLLVAPVFSRDNSVLYYVPAGRWTKYLTGEVIAGPRWVRETHDMFSIPLLVRPGAVIAVGNNEGRPDYDYGQDVTLQVYELADGAQVEITIPNTDGSLDTMFTVAREGGVISATRSGGSKPWRLLLVGTDGVKAAHGGEIGQDDRGALISMSADTASLTIEL